MCASALRYAKTYTHRHTHTHAHMRMPSLTHTRTQHTLVQVFNVRAEYERLADAVLSLVKPREGGDTERDGDYACVLSAIHTQSLTKQYRSPCIARLIRCVSKTQKGAIWRQHALTLRFLAVTHTCRRTLTASTHAWTFFDCMHTTLVRHAHPP